MVKQKASWVLVFILLYHHQFYYTAAIILIIIIYIYSVCAGLAVCMLNRCQVAGPTSTFISITCTGLFTRHQARLCPRVVAVTVIKTRMF